jgi:sulfonate transport system substrate-binding protein
MSPVSTLSKLIAALALGLGLSSAHADTTLRIGYQKSSTLIVLLRQQHRLEDALAGQGIQVDWHEFSSGQPLLEALNVGNVDLSADVADTVPVFAQAAGGQLAYFAQEAPSPAAQAVLVPKGSPLHSLADLKGRKVAVTKAAGSHYLLIAALAKAGLKFSDIQPAYLTPADGRAAFEAGKVDAWVTWEPYLSAAQRQVGAVTLADGNGLASYQRYYLTTASYAKAHPEVLQRVFDELVKAGDWLRAHPDEAARTLAPQWGNLPVEVVEQANGRRSYQVRAVTRDNLGEQQKIADAFAAAGLIPRPIDALDVALWQPGAAQ